MSGYSRPLPGKVTITDDFWTPYIDRIVRVTLPYVLDKLEEVGYMRNYDRVAGKRGGEFEGPPFSDGLLCETLRGAYDFLAAYPDRELEEKLRGIVERIAAASEASPDGFLCTSTLLRFPEDKWGTNKGDIVIQHDLYDHGALIEAGVSAYRATGEKVLLRCALRGAGAILREIGPAPRLNIVPGHSLPEEAMIRLYRLLREDREIAREAEEIGFSADDCLAIALFWYDARGRWEGRRVTDKFSHSYNQDHLPFAAQREALGHAVRATLCYTGAAECVRETGREDMREALDALWDSVVHRKMHISGGIGTRHDIEGFDRDYYLPNDAYLETCAGVGLAFWAGAMAGIGRNSEYMDTFERALCNNVLASIGEDNVHYFYENPLTSDGSIRRWSWHGCPCCPPMLLKLFSSLSTYIYDVAENELSVDLYIGSDIKTPDASVSQRGRAFRIDSYGKKYTVSFRVPDYADGFEIRINGEKASVTPEGGYVSLTRVWGADEKVEVLFTERLRRVAAHPAVKDDEGCVAVMRGAFLLCAEAMDNGAAVDFTLAREPELRKAGDGAEGVTAGGDMFHLIPYYRWCNREGEDSERKMAVWFRQEGYPSCPEDDRLYRDI